MQAYWLDKVGELPEVREVADPRPRPGGVIVGVLAVRVPSYTRDVFAGKLVYDLPVPLIPGPTCVGTVESVGDDVFDFSPGQVVLCNSLLSSGGNDPDEILIGWTGNGSPRSRAMQQIWRHGSFAQKALYPAQCLTLLPGVEQTDRNLLPFLASLAIADGALRRGGINGGQAVVVTGATGQLGGAAVLLALARGAARVAALGRDRARLEALASLDARVRICPLESKREPDARAVRKALGGPADLAIDFLSHTPSPDASLAAFDALRVGGTMVLSGGVRHELPLPYQQIMRRRLNIAGSFMFGRHGAMDTWRLMQSGALDLSAVHAHAFELEEIDAAIETAATLGGLDYALVRPNG